MAFFVTQVLHPSRFSFRRFIFAALAALTLFIALPLADAAQCLGTTRQGNRCKRQTNSSSGYCYQHDPGVKHCAGTTKDGLSCRNLPQSGSPFCKLHKP